MIPGNKKENNLALKWDKHKQCHWFHIKAQLPVDKLLNSISTHWKGEWRGHVLRGRTTNILGMLSKRDLEVAFSEFLGCFKQHTVQPCLAIYDRKLQNACQNPWQVKDRQIGRERLTPFFQPANTCYWGSMLRHTGMYWQHQRVQFPHMLVKAWCSAASAQESCSSSSPGLFLEVRSEDNETFYGIYTVTECSAASFLATNLLWVVKCIINQFSHFFLSVLYFIIPTFRHSSRIRGEEKRVVSDVSETVQLTAVTEVMLWAWTPGILWRVLFHSGSQRIKEVCLF